MDCPTHTRRFPARQLIYTKGMPGHSPFQAQTQAEATETGTEASETGTEALFRGPNGVSRPTATSSRYSVQSMCVVCIWCLGQYADSVLIVCL